MKSYKSLSACNSLFRELQALNEKKLETQNKLERARRKLNRLKRGSINHEEVFEVVREVAEVILECAYGAGKGREF